MSVSSTSIKELFDNSSLDDRINMYYKSKNSSAKDPDRTTSKDLATCSRSSYMQIKDVNGISLHTHVCALLEKLIFQRPPNPVTFFEYYSEEIKKEFRNPIREYGSHFLDSIDQNACENSTELYKNIIWSWNKENRKHSQGLNEFEGENDYEEGDDWMYGESEDGRFPVAEVQELSTSNKAFNKAGCGLTVEEAETIGATMDQMSRSGKLKNIRYWGIMLGLRRNYYVLECEWLDDEIERRVKKSLEVQGVRQPVDVGYDEMAYGEALMDEHDRFTLMAPSEHDPEEERNYYAEMAEDNFEFTPGDEMMTQCQKQLQNETAELLQPEMLGFGTNRKTYFVTHQPSAEWIELPLLKPHHVVQSRKIKRYLVGDLDSPMDCYPMFDGLEKHYLRAQIARITAATQISPVGYLNPVDEIRNITKSSLGKSHPLYHKSVVKKSLYEYSTNQEYKSLPTYDLMDPDNWVHHTPMITEDGVTEVWLDILSTIKQNKNFDGEEFFDDDEDQSSQSLSVSTEDESSTRVGRDVFVSLSEDDFVGESQPWNVEITNKFDHSAAYLAVKSNVWPGAVAVTGSNVMDYTYRGWGQKWDVKSLTPFMHTEYQKVYPSKNMLETKDPTRAEELAVLEEGKQRAEEFKITLLPTSGLEEDDEKVVQKYSYD
ncbi:radial spoke head protein 6 homolog A-like [Adelges cooleyi]|uniref:radial spoke head protein 6 homolog A-like n=1 Tax=Adelges cooleyi TaxID=133065 RepID=UPI00217FA56F|nr:radial spoke head protein 6 homolog A-like [Adelges cooleyi]